MSAPETRPCSRPGCATLAVRRPDETPGEWRNRRYCSALCGTTHSTALRREAAAAARAANPKVCLGCGGAYTRHAGESRAQFDGRKFCSAGCKNANPLPSTVVHPPRPCAAPGCGVVFVPSPRNPHQKYCCPACGRSVKNGRKNAARAASRAAVRPPVEVTCAAPGCTRTFVRGPSAPSKSYCCDRCRDRCRDRAKARPASRSPRGAAPAGRPGRTGAPREAVRVFGGGRLDWACRVLGRDAPVFPESVVRPGSDRWLFGGLVLTAAELIERAERVAARRAARAA